MMKYVFVLGSCMAIAGCDQQFKIPDATNNTGTKKGVKYSGTYNTDEGELDTDLNVQGKANATIKASDGSTVTVDSVNSNDQGQVILNGTDNDGNTITLVGTTCS